MLNIDFHTHVKLTRRLTFKIDDFKEMIQEAKEAGLHAFALTEHLQFEDIYGKLDQAFEYQHDYYDIDGFKVFPGVEVSIQEKGDVLIIGNRTIIKDIWSSLNKMDNSCSMKELLKIINPHNVLVIGAHPLRKSNPLIHIPEEDLRQFDCFDLNASDLYNRGPKIRERVFELAQNIGIPVVAGSDTHHWLSYGSVYNVFEEECQTIDDLKREIQKGAYDIHISPCLKDKVRAASLVKKIQKG